MDNEPLRMLIREKLNNGRLPSDHIPRFWVGPSEDEQCDACGRLILDSLVVEKISSAARDKKAIQMHVSCFAIWDEERREPKA